MTLNKKAQPKGDIASGLPGLGKQKALAPGEKNKPVVPGRVPASAPAPSAKPATSGLDAFMPGAKSTFQSTSPGGAPQGGRNYSASLPEVKEMQKAILSFANIASATDVTSLGGNQQGQQTGEQTRAVPMVGADHLPNQGEENKAEKSGFLSDKEQYGLNQETKDDKEYLGGSDPFGNFIVKNYIPNDSFTGQQYLNVDVAGNKARKFNSTAPMNLRGIIDSIKRIGTPGVPGTEKSADGIWQTRTNNSLHIIADLTTAMLKFVNDMKIKVTGYTPENLSEYQSLVPSSYKELKSNDEIAKRAQDLTAHIVAMTKFFENLKPAVFDNRNLRQYIDQKKPFAKYDKAVVVPDEMKAGGIPGIQFDWIKVPSQNWISLNELSSLDAFKGFVKRIGFGGDPASVKRVLDLVSQKISPTDPNAQSPGKVSKYDPGY